MIYSMAKKVRIFGSQGNLFPSAVALFLLQRRCDPAIGSDLLHGMQDARNPFPSPGGMDRDLAARQAPKQLNSNFYLSYIITPSRFSNFEFYFLTPPFTQPLNPFFFAYNIFIWVVCYSFVSRSFLHTSIYLIDPAYLRAQLLHPRFEDGNQLATSTTASASIHRRLLHSTNQSNKSQRLIQFTIE